MKQLLLVFLFFTTCLGFSQKPCEDRIDSIPYQVMQNATLFSELIKNYPVAEYNKLIDYVSIEISSIHKGTLVVSATQAEQLSKEQQDNIKSADIGSRITIRIKFQYKDPANNDLGSGRTIKEMLYTYKASTLPLSGLPPCGC